MPSVGVVYFRHYLLCLNLLTHQVSQLLECYRYGMVFSLFLLTKKSLPGTFLLTKKGVTEKNVGAAGVGEGEGEGAAAAAGASADADADPDATADAEAEAEGWGEGEGKGKPTPMPLASILELLSARAEARTQRDFQS